MAISGFALTVSTMPVCWKVLNPDSIACRRYGPIGRLVKVKLPFSSVTDEREKLVWVCVALTSTPGSTPPLESRTVPVI